METSVPTTRIERTLALLSDSHAREAARATGRLCAAQNSCSLERRISPPPNADVKPRIYCTRQEASLQDFLSVRGVIGSFVRPIRAVKNRSPPRLLLEVKKALLSAPRFLLGVPPWALFIWLYISMCLCNAPNTVLPGVHLSRDHVRLRRFATL